jgi:hypothetical protein
MKGLNLISSDSSQWQILDGCWRVGDYDYSLETAYISRKVVLFVGMITQTGQSTRHKVPSAEHKPMGVVFSLVAVLKLFIQGGTGRWLVDIVGTG